MAKNFNELRKKMSPRAQSKAHALARKYSAAMALDELREARQMTQEHLASILLINQAAVSKMERRADMYVSTLQSFVKALGGRLSIVATFPDGSVEINQFRQLKTDKNLVATPKASRSSH